MKDLGWGWPSKEQKIIEIPTRSRHSVKKYWSPIFKKPILHILLYTGIICNVLNGTEKQLLLKKKQLQQKHTGKKELKA